MLLCIEAVYSGLGYKLVRIAMRNEVRRVEFGALSLRLGFVAVVVEGGKIGKKGRIEGRRKA